MTSTGAVSAAAGEERQRPGSHEVPVVGTNRRAPSQRGLERSSLRCGHVVEVVAHGSEQLQQTGVVEPGLRLHPVACSRWNPSAVASAASSSDVFRCRPRRRSRARRPCRCGRHRAHVRCAKAAVVDRLRPPRTPGSWGFPRGDAERVGATFSTMTNGSTTTLRRALSGMLRIGAAASITNAWRLGMMMGRPPATWHNHALWVVRGRRVDGSRRRSDRAADVVAAVIAAYNRHDLAGYERLHTPTGASDSPDCPERLGSAGG